VMAKQGLTLGLCWKPGTSGKQGRGSVATGVPHLASGECRGQSDGRRAGSAYRELEALLGAGRFLEGGRRPAASRSKPFTGNDPTSKGKICNALAWSA
jgi:hypothetical protein